MDSHRGLKCLSSQAEIQAAIGRLAAEITGDYRDKNPVLVGVLKGSFVFMADLVRLLDFKLELDFVRLSSYSTGRKTSGNVRVMHGLRSKIKGRDVLIVEDIIDTGLTVFFLLDYLKKKNPASLKLCALADKPFCRQAPVTVDYVGLTVPDKFLVGYGLDYREQYRNLPDICILED